MGDPMEQRDEAHSTIDDLRAVNRRLRAQLEEATDEAVAGVRPWTEVRS